MLSLKQLTDVCLLGQGSGECRYLDQDESDSSKFYCLKKSSARAKDIDAELEELIKDSLMKNKDPKKNNIPLGDNCSGYPLLRNKMQGYDQP